MNQDERIVQLLEELVNWTKIVSIPKVKELLLSILESPAEIVAYQLSDGRASKKVAIESNVSYVTITKWWKKWIKAGIAESISVAGGKRAKRVFSLDDFGIEVPKIMKSRVLTKGGKDSDKQGSDVGAS
jgi:hypothetical protein